MCLAGYQPDLGARGGEGQGTGDIFFLDCANGTLARRPGRNCAPLSPAVLAALRFLCEAPPERAFSFALPTEGLQALSFVTQNYIQAQLGKRLPTLDYYEGMLKRP
jgi:hypothetical protein